LLLVLSAKCSLICPLISLAKLLQKTLDVYDKFVKKAKL